MNEIEHKIELYKIAIDVRNFEIELNWKRNYTFMLVQGGLLTLFSIGATIKSHGNDYTVLISLLGFLISYLWMQINFGLFCGKIGRSN